MRALRVDGSTTNVREVAIPDAGAEVRVRITHSGICNTDLELARGYMGFRGTIGHEFVGVVDHLGSTASTLRVGQRVVGEINAGCGTCALCAGGDSRHCATRTVLGIVARDGAHADFLTLPAQNLIAVPDGVSDLHAVFVEPLAAACGVLERCPLAPSDRVAVIGDGKLGLLIAMVLQASGHAPVLVGKHAAKLAIAAARGIVTTTETPVRGFDVVVEASGSAAGFSRALDLLRPQGALVLKTTVAGTTPVDASRIVVDEIRVIGSRCGRFGPALELLAGRAIDLDPLISDVVSLDRAEAAMAQAASPGALKVVLTR
ncbi:MAG: alcohol dehydrogenase catalytic domain-containing protein [Deltaproteobacteria bacterium]